MNPKPVILDYAKPRSLFGRDDGPVRDSIHGVGRRLLGGLLMALGLGLIVVAVAELRVGCHEAINWFFDGNHGDGYGARYFVVFASNAFLSALALLGSRVVSPSLFASPRRNCAGDVAARETVSRSGSKG